MQNKEKGHESVYVCTCGKGYSNPTARTVCQAHHSTADYVVVELRMKCNQLEEQNTKFRDALIAAVADIKQWVSSTSQEGLGHFLPGRSPEIIATAEAALLAMANGAKLVPADDRRVSLDDVLAVVMDEYISLEDNTKVLATLYSLHDKIRALAPAAKTEDEHGL